MKKFILLSLIYSVVFISIYGFHILDPFYIDWCLMPNFINEYSDVTLNFVDFLGYLNTNSLLPYTDNNSYPNIAGLLYIDCVPILAYFVRLFVHLFMPISNNNFYELQYMGIWGLLCFIFQGLLAYILIRKITKTTFINSLIGSLFFINAPIILERFPLHFALSSQFLILLSFLPFAFYKDFSKKYLLIFYFLLGIFSVGIQCYFVPILTITILGFIIYDIQKTKISLITCSYLPIYFLGSLVSFILLGGISPDISCSSYGYQLFSFNLLGFINPTLSQTSFESFLFPFLNRRIPCYTPFQWESFAYLGAGIILLSILSICVVFYKLLNKYKIQSFLNNYKIEILTFCFMFLFSLFAAISTDITIGNKLILSIPISEKVAKILNIFRCPARNIWLDFYLIYFLVIIFTIKNFKQKTACIILGLCLFLQYLDLYKVMKNYNYFYFQKQNFEAKNQTFWNEIYKDKKLLILKDVDRIKTYELGDTYYYALKNHLKISSLLQSRPIKSEDSFIEQRRKNNKASDVLLFFKEEEGIINNYPNTENCYVMDNHIICIKEDKTNLKKYKWK